MAITHKDINLLTQKATIAGTEKIPVSDTEFITPNQIAGSVTVDSNVDIDSTNPLRNETTTKTFIRGKQMTPTSVVDGHYLRTDGSVGDSGAYHYSIYTVSAGKHYAITAYFRTSFTTGVMRIVVWLNDNNEVVGYDKRGNNYSSDVSYYDELVVAPVGATKAALNCYKTSSSQSFKFVAAPSPDCVLCTSQTLTSDEKAQARTNIGAANAEDIPNITISSSEPTSQDGNDGDIWIVV